MPRLRAFLAVDDAHGIGVTGATGRGALEQYDVLQEVDIVIGTYSKALGNLGGFVIASEELINYLKYQARQHVFSTTAGPSVLGIVEALKLVDREPGHREQLRNNINYLKKGLLDTGLEIEILNRLLYL